MCINVNVASQKNRCHCLMCVFCLYLLQIPLYSVGDAVMVIDDIDKVKELQKDHGEWSECMSTVSITGWG